MTRREYIRIMSKTSTDENGCIVWYANRMTDRYGQKLYGTIKYRRKMRTVHSVMYQTFKGSVPPGLELDHLCRVPQCINPDHLEAVTHLENVRRGRAGEYHTSKTACPHGHLYTPENTAIEVTRRGVLSRKCRICVRARVTAWYRRKHPRD